MNSTKCNASGCSNKSAPTSTGGFCSYHAINEGSHFPGSKKTGGSSKPVAKTTSTTAKKTSGGKGDIFDRLTDTKNYTGVYKERFDEEGKGKGINLVTSHQGGQDLSDMADRTAADVRGLKITDGEEKKTSSGAAKPKKCSASDCKNRASPTSPGGFCSYHASVNKEGSGFPGAKNKAAAKTTTSTTKTSSGAKKSSGGGNIFDRLTDTNNYTGVYKERFDEDGKGKGINMVTSHQGGTQLNDLLDRSPADVRGRKA